MNRNNSDLIIAWVGRHAPVTNVDHLRVPARLDRGAQGGVRLNGAIDADVVDLTGVERAMARRHGIRDVPKNRDAAGHGCTPRGCFGWGME